MVILSVIDHNNNLVMKITLEVAFYNTYYKDYSAILNIVNNEILVECNTNEFTFATTRMNKFC